MAAIGTENPAANLASPPTGLPVPNQGGIPQGTTAPQRTTFKSPIVNAPAGPPGPAPRPLPILGYVHDAMATQLTPVAAPKSQPAQTQPKAPQAPAQPAEPVPRLTEHRLVATISGMPDEHDLEALAEGEAIATRFGEVYREPGGSFNVSLNDAGKVMFEQKRAELHRRVGWYPGLDNPMAPRMEVIPGLPAFNPFAPADKAWIE